jgi:geranylgeranyl diphosphate synthase type I
MQKSKPSKQSEADRELAKKILEILKHKGSKSITIAREALSKEKIQSKEAREALQYYAENFLEPTPPAFLALACEAVGGNAEKTTMMGAAMTLFVGTIDIHDDIIDQSKRKGDRPTVFGEFGKEIALLTGDALFLKGFTLFQKTVEILQPEKMAQVAEVIQTEFFEMGDAHALEVYLKGKLDVTPEEYMQLVKMKAASTEAYIKIGAILGGGTEKEIEALARYGRIWGMLSKLRNDFADLFEPYELKSRMQNEILPLPLLYAFENSAIKKKIIQILSKKKVSKSDLETILNTVFESEEVEKLKENMKSLVEEAKFQISRLKKSNAKTILEQFAQLMLEAID